MSPVFISPPSFPEKSSWMTILRVRLPVARLMWATSRLGFSVVGVSSSSVVSTRVKAGLASTAVWASWPSFSVRIRA